MSWSAVHPVSTRRFGRRTAALGALIAAGMGASLLLGACSDKYLEKYQDAPTSGVRNLEPADIVSMPDGFSNVATKCDNGNRIYVAFKGDGDRAAISVVPDDPSCDG